MAEAISTGVGMPRPKRFGAGVLALGSLLGLAACQDAPSHSMPCPQVQSVRDAAYLTRFAGASEDLTDTNFEARINGVDSKCFYDVNKDTKKTEIRSELTVQISASRGPKNTGDKADVKYYVALTGQGGKQIMRKDFSLAIPLTATKPTATVADDPVVQIPIKEGESGDYYRIYIYFEVTPKELAYNRRNPQQ
jgi:hypothetical protein